MPEVESAGVPWTPESPEPAIEPRTRRLAFAFLLGAFLLLLFASLGAATVVGAVAHASGCGGG